MIVLGITTSGPVEAAIVGDERSSAIAGAGQALSSLLDCITAALGEAETALADVGAIAVCAGPGSFTGLRIGVAFAKGLAQARDLPCIGVSAYDVAEAGSRALYPRAAIVTGKKGYYYARLRAGEEAETIFARGDAPAISQAVEALARESGRPVMLHGECDAVSSRRDAVTAGSFASRGPGDRARAVARLGAARLRDGADADWRRIAIDYGQRPNAVINWEATRARP
ncbi:MAG TPA: tRNA (adenosine(37)-N6)-threonylcarbamoyltransferase complex dimerization subunit type 1 TsaB [Candidatus Eremiobacteraceae bacterium]|nr:tRNA (adenosine(37)-N6)-threonylcarbamoyltransferase complex dimerization subunit type 1 TsaB [Candidatus Eremiobacteraceae bacterium]